MYMVKIAFHVKYLCGLDANYLVASRIKTALHEFNKHEIFLIKDIMFQPPNSMIKIENHFPFQFLLSLYFLKRAIYYAIYKY